MLKRMKLWTALLMVSGGWLFHLGCAGLGGLGAISNAFGGIDDLGYLPLRILRGIINEDLLG